jgi:hypothetical protein
MVCYAQRLITMSCIALVAFLLLGKAVTHSLDVASLVVSVSAVVAGTALAAAIAFLSFRSVRRRRALAGGCVSCSFKCQHAMTEARPARMWLVSTVDRAASGQAPGCGTGQAAAGAAHPGAPHIVPLPMPQWPDRPLRAQPQLQPQLPHPREPAEQRDRVPSRG